MSDDPGIDEIANRIKRRLAQVDQLVDSLIVTASVEEYSEKQFNRLALLTSSFVQLVENLQPGDVIQTTWAAHRNVLVERAYALMDEFPDSEENIPAEQ